jgi:hypothetical protein
VRNANIPTIDVSVEMGKRAKPEIGRSIPGRRPSAIVLVRALYGA